MWKTFKETTITPASAVLGKPLRRNADWFDAQSDVIEPLLKKINLARSKVLSTRASR